MCDVCCPVPEWMDEKEATLMVQRGAPAGKKQKAEGGKQKAESAPVEPELVEYLQEWRRGVSVRENVPALHGAARQTLLEFCRRQPQSPAELLSVTGIGERKAAALRGVNSGGTGSVPQWSTRYAARRSQGFTGRGNDALAGRGPSFDEIARIRERRLNTVIDLVAELVERGRLDFDEKWIAAGRRQQIEDALARLGTPRMKTIKDALPQEITYGEIRLVAAKFRKTTSSFAGCTTPGALH